MLGNIIPQIPLPPLVLYVNILCRVFTCKEPFRIPEIVYDSSENLISAQYLHSRIKESFDFFNVASAPQKNIVEAECGSLEGYYMSTSGGRRIGAFEGIPYATVPERWGKPEVAKGWRGTRQAKAPGSDCLQFHVRKYLRVYGDEMDCLFVNVYTPVISGNKKKAKLPVVIYIHGGSFLFGAGRDHGPAYLLNEDIVLVNFNYRLGILGFMSTGDKVLPGNWGLKDQVLAIKWVHDNIASWGGDPSQITLWGYSAGAVSVHLHLMSNLTKHLFTKGISHGGSAFAHWGVHTPWRARSQTEKIGEYFKCPIKESKALLNCLRKIDPVALVSAQVHLVDWFPFPPVTFVPTVEEDFGQDDLFLDAMPAQLYAEGKVSPKPWILTTTQYEGIAAVLALELLQRYSITKLYWKRVAKHVLDLDYMNLKNTKKIVDKITRFYLGNKLTSQGTPFDYADIISDRYFHFPTVNSLQAHSQIAPTYTYYFSYSKGNYSLGELNLHHSYEWGAGHGEDENFFFNSSIYYPGFQRNDPEYQLSKIMLNFATNFIFNGTPTFTMEYGKNVEIWEQVRNPKKINALLLDTNVRMVTPNLKRIKFWNDLNLSDAKLWVDL